MVSTKDKTGRRGTSPRLSVAPMMERTDRHFRVFMRQLTRHTLLYSEMLSTGAVIHGDRPYLLGFDTIEKPIVLQLGGSDPTELAESARIGQDWGYDEINLNVGCPSDRVQHRRIGACLMAEPALVARCVEAMREAVEIPVTVKHRIGIDDLDTYEDMLSFVDTVSAAGADRFIVHARKAWLSGLSPHENRTIPPLRYEDVYRLKRERSGLWVEINGHIDTVSATLSHLQHVDGVMIGRAAYENPYLFASVDRDVFGDQDAPVPSRTEVIEAMADYVDRCVGQGIPARRVTMHMIYMLRGQPGSRRWRQHIARTAQSTETAGEALRSGLRLGPEGANPHRDAPPGPADLDSEGKTASEPSPG